MSARGNRTLRQWWTELDRDRTCQLDRKREHAMLTMPSLLPWQGRVSTTPLEVPYSSTPADGINALASRIMGVVLPLNGQPIFEIGNVTPFDPEGKDDTELSDVFNRFGRYTMRMLSPTNLRSQLNVLYTHLVAIGDCLMVMDDSLNARLFRADQYVVRRKHEGDWVDILIQEAVLPEFLPELQQYLSRSRVDHGNLAVGSGREERWEILYTHVHKDPDTGTVTKRQEFRDGPVGQDETFPVSPYMPTRWKALIGESMGISLVEDSFGDIRAVDVLAKGLLDGVLLGAEHRMGVNPAGITELQDLLDSVNGDYVPMGIGDVFPVQYNNAAQVAATQESVVHRENVINRKFLKRVARDSERTTAREIVMDAQDLEGQLGGILSMAGREVQDPLVRWTLYIAGKRKLIPDIISKEIQKQNGLVKLSIKAGLEVLQREADREKLDGAIERMRNLPEQAQRVFIWEEIARDWWQSMGLDAAGRVKTAAQLQQEDAAQAQQQAQLMAAQAAMNQGVQAQQESNAQ